MTLILRHTVYTEVEGSFLHEVPLEDVYQREFTVHTVTGEGSGAWRHDRLRKDWPQGFRHLERQWLELIVIVHKAKAQVG